MDNFAQWRKEILNREPDGQAAKRPGAPAAPEDATPATMPEGAVAILPWPVWQAVQEGLLTACRDRTAAQEEAARAQGVAKRYRRMWIWTAVLAGALSVLEEIRLVMALTKR